VSVPGLDPRVVPPWLHVFPAGKKLLPGAAAGQPLRVPVADAQKVLAATERLVADLPAGVAGDVVWTQGASELLVHTDAVTLACTPGVVSLSIPVTCDHVPGGATVIVPLAVGSQERPAGLVMSSFSRPAGPASITAVWAQALTAFAWESLIHLAEQLAAAAGKDHAGRTLVPAEIGAAQGLLIILPMARNELAAPTGGAA